MSGKLNGLLAVVVAGVVSSSLPAAAQEQPRPTGPDQALVGRLRLLGQQQIATAQLGQTRAVRARVRAFAEATERDQKAADDQLMAYAARKNMNLPEIADPGAALPHGVLARAPLANSSPEAFDYNFIAKVIADQQAAIDATTAAIGLARDPDLKALLGGQLKMLSDRLASAQELAAAIPAPAPRVVQMPGEPAGISRTQTGADVPPPAAFAR